MRTWVVTPEDLKGGELADPGWHPAVITEYKSGEAGEGAKNPGSATCTFFFKLTDTKDGKEVTCRRLFSEVAWGFAKTFFATMGYPKDEKGNYQISEELFQQSVGHKLMIYIVRGKSNQGNDYNEVKDFKPLAA